VVRPSRGRSLAPVERGGREKLFALGGGVIGLALGCGLVALAYRGEGSTATHPSKNHPSDDADAGEDPAMAANAALAESLRECTQKLATLTEDKADLLRQLEAARKAADAVSAASPQGPLKIVSQDDWKNLSRTGTIRYLLPCAAFNPQQGVMDRLGIGSRDVPIVRDAFAAARNAAWSQIRPLCVQAVGNAATADQLGFDACPRIILASAKTANANEADNAMRAVSAVQAGLADRSTLRSGDPVTTTLLALTGMAADAESRVGSRYGAEDTRRIVYGDNACSRMVELGGPGPAPAQR
jgi:hypothetical protein